MSDFKSCAISTGTAIGYIGNATVTTDTTLTTGAYPLSYSTSTSDPDPFQSPFSKLKIDPTSLTITIKDKEEFTDVKEIVPFKVYLFTFGDDSKIKTVRDDLDEFDLEYMFYLALAKKIYSSKLTFEGVLNKAHELQYEKRYVKLVKKGIKLFNNIQKKQVEEEEKEAIKKRRHEKLVRKKQAAKERKREDKIDIIAEAIKRSKWEF